MGLAGASRKQPNCSFWDTLSQSLSRQISAPLRTAVLSCSGIRDSVRRKGSYCFRSLSRRTSVRGLQKLTHCFFDSIIPRVHHQETFRLHPRAPQKRELWVGLLCLMTRPETNEGVTRTNLFPKLGSGNCRVQGPVHYHLSYSFTPAKAADGIRHSVRHGHTYRQC